MKNGLIIGKFMPLHRGHCFLIDMALAMCDNLYIFICSRKEESISGIFRLHCLQTQYPQAKIYHITKEIKDAHANNPEAPQIWSKEIYRIIDCISIDYVFASEDYGKVFAQHLGANFIMVDPQRTIVPVSGATVRANLYQNWEYLASSVKPYLVKIIGIRGNKDLVFSFVKQLGALYCAPYSVTIEKEAMPIEQFQLVVNANLIALKKLNYPLVVWHYDYGVATDDMRKSENTQFLDKEKYEQKMLDEMFFFSTVQDVENTIAWWKAIEQRKVL